MGSDIRALRHTHVPDHRMLKLAFAAEAAEVFSALSDEAATGMVGSVVTGIGLTATGVQHLREAVKQRCLEEMVEGSGAVVLGLHSCTHALIEGSNVLHHHALASAAHTAHPVLTTLGVVNGSLDLALGTFQVAREMKHGRLHVGGLLSIGLGGATIASALGGGLAATIAATMCLAGKLALEGAGSPTNLTGPTAHTWHILNT